jgi:hypothetical protein
MHTSLFYSNRPSRLLFDCICSDSTSKIQVACFPWLFPKSAMPTLTLACLRLLAMLDASGNRDAQEKVQFNILKSAIFVAGKPLDSHGVLQIPGLVDSTFNALAHAANQGEESTC